MCIFRPLPGPEEVENVCCVHGDLLCYNWRISASREEK